MTHKNIDLPANTDLRILTYLLQRSGVAVAHCRDKDTGSSSFQKYPLPWALLECAISPTKQPVGSSAGSPKAKQPIEQEHSPTYQQTSDLNSSWAFPCQPERQDPIAPTAEQEPAHPIRKPAQTS